MKELSYLIKDHEGIHARPAGLLMKTASCFHSQIMLCKGGKKVDAKRIFAIMGLGVKCGEKITITCEGIDEADAASKLKIFLEENL